MKKAADKIAVRMSCVVFAALFFFLSASAATLRQLYLTYGCAVDDAAGLTEIISKLYDKELEVLQPLIRTYFESGEEALINYPTDLDPNITNFRFRVHNEIDGKYPIIERIKYTYFPDPNYENDKGKNKHLCYENKEISIQFFDEDLNRKSTKRVMVDCALCNPLDKTDMFTRAIYLVRTGEKYADILWSVTVVAAAAALVCALYALRSVIREAKRTRGANRLFNMLPPDLYVCCVLPAFVFLCLKLFGGSEQNAIDDNAILFNYLKTGSGDFQLLLRAAYLTGLSFFLLILLMLLVYSLRRGGVRYVFAISRFGQAPFARRTLVYLLLMQIVKALAILLYLTNYTRDVVLFLLLEKIITLPVVYRMLRELRTLMDTTARFAEGDLSGAAACERDYATIRMHGADVDSIVRRIRESADEYVRNSNFKAELITNLSHDIKTPLTSIINYAELLRRSGLSREEREQYLDVLQRHSDRLQKLVEDLTEVSDAASGNVPVQMTVVDLCAVVRAAALAVEERLQKQNISVYFKLPRDPVFVTADPHLLQRVADNLMNNICKYTRSGTQVQIAVVDGVSSVAAVFRNRSSRPLTLSGEALMERFVREDGSRHTDGSGLGLSIAQSLMRLQGGKLWLHTEGDVFTAQMLFRKP